MENLNALQMIFILETHGNQMSDLDQWETQRLQIHYLSFDTRIYYNRLYDRYDVRTRMDCQWSGIKLNFTDSICVMKIKIGANAVLRNL